MGFMGNLGTDAKSKRGPDPLAGTAKLRLVRHMNTDEEDIIMSLNPRERALAMLAYADRLNDSHLVEIAEPSLLGTLRPLAGLLDTLGSFNNISAERLQFLLAENGIGRCQQCDKWMRMDDGEFCEACANS